MAEKRNDKMQEIMDRLKNRRIELDMSYQTLASKVGISKSTLQRYETGNIKNMPIDKLEEIAKALMVSPSYLMGWDDAKPIIPATHIDSDSVENEKEIYKETIGVESLVSIGDGLYYDSATSIVYWWKGYYDSCSSITPSPYYAPNGLPYRYNPKTNMLEEIKLKEDIIEMFQEIIAELHAKNAELSMKNKEIEELLKTDKMSGAMDSSGGNYEVAFADNTWDEIAKACQSNAVPSTWKVGDTKKMKINGTSYTVAIIGKNHDTYADGSGTAPLTFQVIDIVEERKMNSSNTNRGSWDESELYSYLQNDMLNSLEDGVKNNIKAVSKKTNLGGADTGNNATTTETSSDKLFLLSEVEITGNAFWDYYAESVNDNQITAWSNVIKAEGSQYAYYKPDGSVTTEPTWDEFTSNWDFNYWYSMNKATLKYNGASGVWWLRSPIPYYSSFFNCVDGSGDSNYYFNASVSLGVAFGFCF